MTYVFVCIDLDRDYAIPLQGRKHAVSEIKKHEPDEITRDPKLSASIKGTVDSLEFLIPFLIDKTLPTTFYHEARSLQLLSGIEPSLIHKLNQSYFEHGLHGYDHEDLSGEESGYIFSEKEEYDILYEAKGIVENLLTTVVQGFRAPYMKLSSSTMKNLSKLDFKYDTSIYKEADCGIIPYKVHGDILEFPVIKTPKESSMKGMYTYLWPLFEGKRSKAEVIESFVQLLNNSESKNSFISINLHSWHFAYLISEKRYLTEQEVEKSVDTFKELIQELVEHGALISTPIQWMRENHSF